MAMGEPALRRRLRRLAVADRYLGSGHPDQSERFLEREQLTAELQQRFPPELNPEWTLPVIEEGDFRPEDFEALSHGRTRPVVIRGLWKQSPAVQTWSLEHLRDTTGEQELVALDYTDLTPEDLFSDLRMVRTRLDHFLDKVETADQYINSSTELFSEVPQVYDDLQIDRLEQLFDGRARATNLFIGGPKVYSTLHCAFGGNFFLNIVGRKRWQLLDPCYTPYVLPVFPRPFLSAFSPWCYRFAPEDHFIRELPYQEVELEPGDMVYNPPWWWHEVSNLTPFTIGSAVRWGMERMPMLFTDPNWQNNALFSAMSPLVAVEARFRAYQLMGKVVPPTEPYAQGFNRVLGKLIRRYYKSLGDFEKTR